MQRSLCLLSALSELQTLMPRSGTWAETRRLLEAVADRGGYGSVCVQVKGEKARQYGFECCRGKSSEPCSDICDSADLLLTLEQRGQAAAILRAWGAPGRALDMLDERWLRILGQQLIDVLDGAQLSKKSERPGLELAVLNQIAQAVSANVELPELLELIHRETSRVMDGSNFYIALFDEENPRLVVEFETRGGVRYPENRVIPVGGLWSFCMQEGRPLVISQDLDHFCRARGIQRFAPYAMSWMGAPLRREGKLLGLIVLQDFEREGVFDEAHLSLLTHIASQAAVAIDSNRHQQQIRTMVRALANSTDCIALVDLGKGMEFVNEAFLRTFGYAWDEVKGKSVDFLWSPKLGTGVPEQIRLEAAGRGWKGEVRALRRNGEEFPFYLSLASARDRKNQPVALVLIGRDTSQEKRLQLQLIQSEKMVTMGELISGIAHELNNPLTSVLGFAQVGLMENGLSPKAEHVLRVIERESLRASKIIGNLLAFARQHKPAKVPTDLHALLDAALAIRDYQLRINCVAVTRSYEPNLPRVLADPHQLQQVFLNLILNAEQAILEVRGRGRLTIESKLAPPERLHSCPKVVSIAFTDDGIGIPEENLRKIFDPFFTTKPVGKGTGLGLSVSYAIIAEHGGQIFAKSEPGAGTTFYIELPIPEKTPSPLIMPASRELAECSPAKILVVEDETEIAEIVQAVLKRDHHQVDWASNGEEALTRLEAKEYDALITDIKMPLLDGVRLHQIVAERWPALLRRIIFMTGDTVSGDTQRFLQQTGSPSLSKPFTIEALLTAVRQILKANPRKDSF